MEDEEKNGWMDGRMDGWIDGGGGRGEEERRWERIYKMAPD